MMAALTAAQGGASVALLERNPKLGRKLYITGKGRCNVTNHCSVQEVLDSTPRNSRFLYGAMTRTPPAWVEDFFRQEGVPLKVERGNRVFPESDRAADIIDALFHALRRSRVRVLEVDRSDRSRPRVTASVKQAMENPYEKALKKYVVGNRYVGTVSMVDLNGVFVSLDGGIDCLCTYPKRGRPPRGARATVRILGINHENNRIWGVITHMSTTR